LYFLLLGSTCDHVVLFDLQIYLEKQVGYYHLLLANEGEKVNRMGVKCGLQGYVCLVWGFLGGFLVVLGFDFRASCLLGRPSTT
jgi:hypothetical protein